MIYYSAGTLLPDKDIGEIVYQRTEDGKTKIIHADPKILITYEFAFVHNDEKYVKCNEHPWKIGSVITLKDDFGNGYLYVIREEDFSRMAWLAEWPD
jgi:hypothetical protein